MPYLLADALIPDIQKWFSNDFDIHFYHDEEELKDKIPQAVILICRSTIPINDKLIQNTQVQIVASASSGINHIDLHALKKANIVFLDAKGGNAPAVCDYMTAALAYLEKENILKQPKIAIIGFGHVGQKVSERFLHLGHTIGIYDPLSPPAEYQIHLKNLHNYDLICLHPNYHHMPPHPSHHFISSEELHKLKEQVCIINASRGGVVDEKAILSSDFKGLYCADVFSHEPKMNPSIIERAMLATPHIAGHTVESRQRMTYMIAEKIYTFFNLTLPGEFKSLIKPIPLSKTQWREQVLDLYNPIEETKALKANPTELNFLELRKAHRRFEFNLEL